ncbi:hypothetical protein NDU88_004848 [Pleurodeles waltl]|uniref:Uncharacterized protein n=1 Tax=Pleurodeles waltl TaxID=8319 RepID=A0AAV7PDP1_PLEWA|nr:hypothetical protein NDU88_004848 [Pleurodeles waltl]
MAGSDCTCMLPGGWQLREAGKTERSEANISWGSPRGQVFTLAFLKQQESRPRPPSASPAGVRQRQLRGYRDASGVKRAAGGARRSSLVASVET